MKIGNKKILGLSLCAAFLIHGSVFAAENDTTKTSLGTVDVVSSSDTESTNSYTLDSTKSATKLSLSLKDTPQSVSVFTHQKLEDLGITSYQEILASVTGVSMSRWDERLNSSARGFTIDYYKVDGMPTYTSYDERDLDLSIFDRVEIVRGANGLLTGAGNPGMSINLIRKRAKSKEFAADITLKAGSFDSYSGMVDVSSKLNESGSVRGRLIAKYDDNDSYMDYYEKENKILYGVVDVDLSDSSFLSFGANYQDLDRNGIRWGGLPAFYSDGSRTNFDTSDIVSNKDTYWNAETKGVFVDFKQYFANNILFNLSLSHNRYKSESSLLYFGGTVDKATGVGIGSISAYENEDYKKENNIDAYVSVPFNLANLDHEVILGYTYNTDSKKYDNQKGSGGGASSLANPLINFNNINLDSFDNFTSYSGTPNKIKQTAAYLVGKFSLMEDLKLIAGARLTNWKYTEDGGVNDREFDNELTPYVGLVYDLNENHSIYTSYTSIFKPDDKKDRSGNYLDPLEGKNYEAGIKGEYFDGKLNASLSIFRIEQDGTEADGAQINGYQPYTFVEGVTSKGFEFDIHGQLTDNFSLSMGVANFKAEDAEGNKFNTKASRTTANLFAKYTMDKLQLGAGLNYKSKYYTGSDAQKITQDAFTLANAMASYKIDKNSSLQLNVNNIFDKEYYEGIGNNLMIYGTPRNATLTYKYTF
ncbi:TonB-dependent siderophore receptor [Arcobacter sp. CECT 8989]|uniref:TonB-dependent siderophore receptor n=1 Tax=Arcobacter sp. CECT 8989 TaxID=2044509 RepID=UPI00215A02DB|nr:TonB-dependent siderophore receptor [Arcobacter sp. CECT 8989]